MTDSQQTKQKAIDILRRRVARQSEQLREIEPRLLDYYEDLCQHSGTELGDPNDMHCTMELLGAVRLLRLLRTYGCDTERVRQVIYIIILSVNWYYRRKK